MKRTFKFIIFFFVAVGVIVGAKTGDLAASEQNGITSVAGNAILVDQNSGNVLWSRNAYEKAYPASTTKLMTAIVYYEKFQNNLDKYVVVGDELKTLPAGSSIMGVEKDEEVTREQLLYGLMLVSGNDAAIVMAQDHSGGMDAFAQAMNSKAKEFGMNSTHFVNSHGFHDENHYTTAADFAILAKEYMKYDGLRKIASDSKYEMAATNKKEKYTMLNSNRLITLKDQFKEYRYEKATGLKTGFTSRAKNCFVASASNGYTGLIFVGFGYEHSETRFTEAKKIMEYGFNSYTKTNVYNYIKDARPFVDVSSFNLQQYEYGHVDSTIEIGASEDVYVDKAIANSLEGVGVSGRFNPLVDIQYPVKQGDLVGHVEYYANDTLIYTAKAYASKDLEDRKIPGLINMAIVSERKGYRNAGFMEQMVALAMEQKGGIKITVIKDEENGGEKTETNTQTGNVDEDNTSTVNTSSTVKTTIKTQTSTTTKKTTTKTTTTKKAA